MAKVVCLGELLVDMVSDASDASLSEAERFVKAPGGAPANVAVGLARMGVPSAFVGKVGDDPFGHWLRDSIAQEQVDVDHLALSGEARTTIAFVATRSDGNKDICFYRNPGADALLAVSDLTPELFQDVQLFHCCSLSLSLSPAREAQFEAARRARQAGALVSFDPNWRPSIWSDHELAHRLIWETIPLSDIVKVADEEWEFVTGESDFAAGAAKIRALGPRLVIVTKGADGAYFNCAGAAGDVPGFAVAAISTLGAGDAFVAGLIAEVLSYGALDEVLNPASLEKIVRFANACGALATLKHGAIPALPTRAEVEAFIKGQW